LDAVEALRAALSNLSAEIAAAGARVEVGELPRVVADPTRLTQVFQNLVGNAIKHRGERAPVVSVRSAELNGSVRIEVEDNGPGIPPDAATRVFEPFLQLGEDVRGSGLGLALVKQIVEQHGGAVAIHSAPGGGACFSFTLPRAA